MNIKILYDNNAQAGYISGWGFSSLINNETLFDTGKDADSLLKNMQKFGIDLSAIKHVILSHKDADHIGGIAVLKHCKNINVYTPEQGAHALRKTIRDLKIPASVCEISTEMEINSGMFVTACLGTTKKEISLAVKTSKGLILVTGCAHPGLDSIINKAGDLGNIRGVIGGFHNFDKLNALRGMEIIVPCHCTKMANEIKSQYPDNTQLSFAGLEIEIK